MEIKSIDRNYAPLCQTEVLNCVEYDPSKQLIAACTKDTIFMYGNQMKHHVNDVSDI